MLASNGLSLEHGGWRYTERIENTSPSDGDSKQIASTREEGERAIKRAFHL